MRALGVRWCRSRLRRFGRLGKIRPPRQVAGIHRHAEGENVCITGEEHVDPLEPFRRAEEEIRPVPNVTMRPRGRPSEPFDAGPAELVERSGLGGSQQGLGRPERTNVKVCLCGGDVPLRTLSGVSRQGR